MDIKYKGNVSVPQRVIAISSNISFLHDLGSRLWPTAPLNPDEKRSKVILSILLALSQVLEPTSTSKISAKYSEFFSEDEKQMDLARRLSKFFGDVIGHDSKITRLL